jgi:hypothetical protein
MSEIRKSPSFEINRSAPASSAAAPASSAPTPAAPASSAPASDHYTEEGRKIVNSLDKIGKQLIDKANNGGTLEDLDLIITSSQSQALKESLKEEYDSEVITAAIKTKLLKIWNSAHTVLSKSVYINFLNEFLGELTPKEQSRQKEHPRQTGRALAAKTLVLPDFI